MTTKKKNKKSPRGITPPFPPPLGVQKILRSLKIHALACVAKDATRMFGRAKTGGLGQVTTKKMENNKNKKSPRGIRPRRCFPPPPGGVRYVTVTQDKSPCLCSERHDEYLFGRAKTGGLGQVTTKKKKKKTTEKKWVLLDPVLTAG